MFKVAIFENNQEQLVITKNDIKKIIKDNSLDAEIVINTIDYNVAKTFVETNHANIYFLDVSMQEGDDFEIPKLIYDKSKTSFIVFITARLDYYFSFFDVSAKYYFLKPYDYQHFEEIFIRLYNDFFELKKICTKTNETKKITIKSRTIIHHIDIDDIMYVEINKNILTIHTTTEKIDVKCTLQEFESIINDANDDKIFKIHKSFLLNKDYISKIYLQNNEIILINGILIPFGRQYKNFIKNILD